MSSRLLVLALIASFGSGSFAFAEESLLQSGSRIVQDIARAQSLGSISDTRTVLSRGTLVNRIDPVRSEVLLAQEQPGLSKGRMSKKTKAMIYVAAAVGFAFTAYEIDHHVLNVTPSTLGTRKD